MLMNIDSLSMNAELYIRSKEDCFKIDAGNGLNIYELLGKQNGNSDTLSIALEDFAPEGSSPAHYHSKAEEFQVILEGNGKLVIGNETRTVTKGDFVRIPSGARHQTFNEDQKKSLKLCCFLTPSWTFEDSIFTEELPSIQQEKIEIYMRRKENCFEINAGQGETIYELLGKENGSSENISIALVEIDAGCSSEAHLHPKSEESYIITEGKGRLVIDGQTRFVTCNDLVKIPMGKVHQIFNDMKETLKLLCVCTPAWTPDCYIKV